MSRSVIVLGNSAGWCGRSWSDIKKINGGILINKHFPGNNKFVDVIVRIHYSERVNNLVNLPFKGVWFSYFIKHLIPNKKEDAILVIYDGNKLGNNELFLRRLRAECKNLKMVYVITNEVQYCMASKNRFYEKLRYYYDKVYGFHLSDKKKYGIDPIPLVYSKNEIPHGSVSKRIFFAGEAKTRLNRILDIYKKTKAYGFGAKIVALHVDEADINSIQKTDDEMLFNHPISYDEVLKDTQESAIIVEVQQDGLEAITIKTCEAIFYNKLLISMNPLLKKMPFYDPRYMLYIESPEDITQEFLDNWNKVEYDQKAVDYFSVKSFLERLDIDLKLNNRREKYQ